MAVEYDVVVIDRNGAGVQAAIAAAQLQARVALVLDPASAPTTALRYQVLREAGRQAASVGKSFWLEAPSFEAHLRLERAMQWAETVAATLADQRSTAWLASLGIDVILAKGHFQPSPLRWQVEGQSPLQARNFLLAADKTMQPARPGLETCWTPATLLHHLQAKPQSWPQVWGIIGGGIEAVELSQILIRWGRQVTMIVEEPQILPHEDQEAVVWLRAQLEAEGVRILTNCQIEELRTHAQKRHLVTTAGIVEVEELLLTTEQQPAIADLNLEAVGVQWSQRKLWVNRKLQTTNSRIYACGAALGGYSLAHVARYEAQVALKNALFLPLFSVNYGTIPWAVFTDPELARVGLTENQAQRAYGGSIRVLRQFYKGLPQAQIQGETTGFCKLIGDAQDRLLGAHLVGPAASEIIHLLALGIKKKLTMQELAALVQVSPTFSEIVSATASGWPGAKPPRAQFWEWIFNLRRPWSA